MPNLSEADFDAINSVCFRAAVFKEVVGEMKLSMAFKVGEVTLK